MEKISLPFLKALVVIILQHQTRVLLKITFATIDEGI